VNITRTCANTARIFPMCCFNGTWSQGFSATDEEIKSFVCRIRGTDNYQIKNGKAIAEFGFYSFLAELLYCNKSSQYGAFCNTAFRVRAVGGWDENSIPLITLYWFRVVYMISVPNVIK